MQTSDSTGRRKRGPFWTFVGAVAVVGVTLAFLPASLPTWAVGLGWAIAGALVTAYRTAYLHQREDRD